MLRAAGCIVIAIAMSAASAAAQELSQQQKNAVNHIAQVVATESYCNEYRANARAINALAKVYSIDLDAQYIRNVTALLAANHLNGLKAAGKQVGCLTAWGLYGPGGENVPNLLVKR
ncbi:hypothetical protein GCM10019059_07460 [Camelimonas fluminis]|uniref:Uncharacterized protein n=1 Tax=Camelimonas fluminis TaxID=1576911 RepID=A0ABV7UEH0_9HYPH|nr:hypothetical protein [Camelimonas fluminis]GHE50864.1 hypothetical protein GCM10019059_07460 [Camelimonas fluminis]